jgi:anti-anti-sigma regulatory factor
MTKQLVCRPEKDLPVAILRVGGVLDLITSDALERAVARSLSAQPEALLIDVAGLEVADPKALGVLDSFAGSLARWPDVPVVLCGAGPATTTALATWPDCPSLSTAESCEAALAEIKDEPEPRRIRVRLRPVPDACRQVRQLVTQTCAKWQQRAVAPTAALVATELVANVVRHAHTTMEFTFGMHDGRVSMTVRDHSRALPKPADPAVTAAGGRGLRLVRDLSEAWGVLPVTDGKVVWSRLATA